MGNMDGWDLALLAAAAYLAVVSLVRLMIRRRDQLRDEFHREVKKEKKRRAVEQRRKQAEREHAA